MRVRRSVLLFTICFVAICDCFAAAATGERAVMDGPGVASLLTAASIDTSVLRAATRDTSVFAVGAYVHDRTSSSVDSALGTTIRPVDWSFLPGRDTSIDTARPDLMAQLSDSEAAASAKPVITPPYSQPEARSAEPEAVPSIEPNTPDYTFAASAEYVEPEPEAEPDVSAKSAPATEPKSPKNPSSSCLPPPRHQNQPQPQQTAEPQPSQSASSDSDFEFPDIKRPTNFMEFLQAVAQIVWLIVRIVFEIAIAFA